MLHAKFQNHRPSGSGEDFKGFCDLLPWRPSWSCDLDHLNKLLFPLPNAALPYTEYPLRMLKFEIRAEFTIYDANVYKTMSLRKR